MDRLSEDITITYVKDLELACPALALYTVEFIQRLRRLNPELNGFYQLSKPVEPLSSESDISGIGVRPGFL